MAEPGPGLGIAYASAADYRREIKPDASIDDDPNILIDLTRMSRHLDGKLGRFFGQDAADVTRVYAPSTNIYQYPGMRKLTFGNCGLDDYVSVTSVTLGTFGDTWETSPLDTADYELRPSNAALGPEPWPYTEIVLHRGVLSAHRRIQVIGVAGWPAIPEAIRGAVIQYTALYRREGPMATNRFQETMEGAIEASPDARRLLRELMDRYRRDFGFA